MQVLSLRRFNLQADRMLDMGFIDSVKALITKMPKVRRHGLSNLFMLGW